MVHIAMSATLAPMVADTPPADDDPLDRFDDLLFENAEICSHCFSHIRDETEHDLERLGNSNKPTETRQRAGVGVAGHTVIDLNRYGTKRKHETRTFCGECGSQSGHALGDHIHSRQAIRRICDRIVRRLHEQGYYPHLPTLYGVTLHLKRQPDHQGRDREILATAVHMAIERGGRAPGR